MATITIRNLDDDTKARLRVDAAKHGRSMEEHARVLLAAAVAEPERHGGLGTWINSLVVHAGAGDDLDAHVPARSGEADRIIDLDR